MLHKSFRISPTITVSVLLRGWFGAISIVDSETILIGRVTRDGASVNPKSVARALSLHSRPEEIESYLARLNGFFAVITVDEHGVLLASDRIRSRPLFYSATSNSIKISDDAQWVKESSDGSPDTTAQNCFLRSLYTPFHRTFARGVHQLEASQYVRISTVGEVSRYRWHTPTASSKAVGDETHASSKGVVEEAIKASAREACVYANGRQIVVPVSAGLDSRAVLAAIVGEGYDHVASFSYGRAKSRDLKGGEAVAQALKVPWTGIRYSRQDWRRRLGTPAFAEFHQRTFSLVSCPNLQAFPAMQEIAERGLFERDAVFMPGHTGDFFAGSQLDRVFLSDDINSVSKAQCIELVLGRHFNWNRHISLHDESLTEIRSSLEALLQPVHRNGIQNPALHAVQMWNLLERQAKFIANSNRYFDFFGFDWWMPLWDTRFVSSWATVPATLRHHSALWREIVGTLVANVAGNRAASQLSAMAQTEEGSKIAQRVLRRVDSNLLIATVPKRVSLLHLARAGSADYSPFAWWARRLVADYTPP